MNYFLKSKRKIKRKIVELDARLKKKIAPPLYEFVAADISSNCNLRCPFCVNDFSKINGNILMTESTFEKVLTLLPLVSNCNFFISCLYEPGIHPQLVSFLEKIPRRYRKKVFFTTNLAVKMSDEDIERLSRTYIHHINISLDSLNPGIFEKLRKGATFDRFIDNLERLTFVFKKQSNAPKIRYSTVVLKSNLEGIPDLLETCARRYFASNHELRYIYQVPHLSAVWKQNNLISNEEWVQLQKYADECPFYCEVVQPPPVYYPDDGKPYSRNLKNCDNSSPIPTPDLLSFGLKVSSDGTVSLYGRDDIRFNINQLDHPGIFFKQRRKQFQDLTRDQ
jgi:MoaA/NifB/PqqE/SkfB family radical SAM enzyme